MKNIHLIPTDKPSRLLKFANQLIFDKETEVKDKRNQNLYITSDEEIKDGDYWIYICPINGLDYGDNGNPIVKNNLPSTWFDRLHDKLNYKKIILTTDQDLIKDGVQAIDNEFLEWFVKNPSCEEIEVVDDTFTVGEMSKLPLGTRNHKYKIIIPKEEIKPHSFCETPEEKCTMNYCDENGCMNRKRHLVESKEEQKQHLIDMMRYDEELGLYEEPEQETLPYTEAAKKEERVFNSNITKQKTLEKIYFKNIEEYADSQFNKQETPEEAAERVKEKSIICCGLSKQIDYITVAEREKNAFINGIKWQQEKMYSEEEVLEQLNYLNTMPSSKLDLYTDEDEMLTSKWFEQFKKK